jgi:hypothetical protein
MGFTRTVVGFLIASASLFAITALMELNLWRMALQGWASDFELQLALDAASGMNAFASFSYVVTGILFLIWFASAYRSAKSRGATETRWGPGWAVGAWFIPFANLVIPKLTMNEIDRMSRPELTEPIGSAWKQQNPMSTSFWWWATHVGGSLLLGAAAWVLPSFVDQAQVIVPFYLFGHALLAAAGGLLAATVLQIGHRLRV